MNSLVLVLGLIGSCFATGWDFGDHGLTLGEISLDHGGAGLGIELGEEVGGWDGGLGVSGHSHGIIPVVKSIGVPVPKKVEIPIKTLEFETKRQEYPIYEFRSKPVPFEVEKPVFTRVEKKVPTPVEKIIPIKVEKPVPITIIKPIPVPIVKRIPIKIPVYKTIVHRVKGGHHW